MTEDLGEAEKLIREYPWLQEIYEEIAMLRRKPEEVLGMFSEALKILDQNTIKYMIEMQQKELEEKEAQLKQRDAVISEKDTVISEKDAVISERNAVISEKDTAISQRDIMIEAQKEEIANLKKRLENQLRVVDSEKEGMST